MKSSGKILLTILAITFGMTMFAFATAPISGPESGTKETDGTFTPDDEFYIDQDIPFLSITFDKNDLKVGETYKSISFKYVWSYEEVPGVSYTDIWTVSATSYMYFDSPVSFLRSIDERSTVDWGTIEQLGTWKVVPQWKVNGIDSTYQTGPSVFFEVIEHVAPEPVSAVLFLLGGGACLALRRKK